MTARILPFPPRGPFAVRIEREDEGGGLVLCRQYGWLHGSWREAITEAGELARGFGVAVVLEARP
jgi:hypothetical protein